MIFESELSKRPDHTVETRFLRVRESFRYRCYSNVQCLKLAEESKQPSDVEAQNGASL